MLPLPLNLKMLPPLSHFYHHHQHHYFLNSYYSCSYSPAVSAILLLSLTTIACLLAGFCASFKWMHSNVALCVLLLCTITSIAADDVEPMSRLLEGFNSTPSSWSPSTNYCTWEGVVCDPSKRVVSINLTSKSLTGSLPDIFNSFSNLQNLTLSYNKLTGPVPKTLISSSSLQVISLDNNKLQGPLPDFGSSVNKVAIHGNNFCQTTPGPCDQEVTTLLEVAGALSYPILLADVWQGNNVCVGWSYIICNRQGKVITVTFIKLGFTGIISPAFSNLKSLRMLVMRGNHLYGSIPDSLVNLPQLYVLDVSNNNLTGTVPKFTHSVLLNTSGNAFLETTPSTGEETLSTPAAGPNAATPIGGPALPSNGSSMLPGLILGVCFALIFILFVVSFVVIKCYAKHESVINIEDGNDGANELHNQGSGHLNVSEGGDVAISIQVLRQATNNFSQDNILGRGGFGDVYKGELHDGTKIAVKKMKSVEEGTKRLKEFQAEIGVLTKVRHRHLVALLGYCISGNERLLVYEYMSQGTLRKHLFDWPKTGVPPLTWRQRVTIALDVARGVEYLHNLAQQTFIHRDLNPANILLGDGLRAKVSDFGLVKNLPDDKSFVETQVAGTYGYLAPECAATGRVSKKVDVYAFGVVLMELMSGRKALDTTLPEDRSLLVSWFRAVLVNIENISKEIDQTLEHDEETLQSIFGVADLAVKCTAREPHQRPDMKHVVNILAPLVEPWNPTTNEEEEDEENSGIDLRMSLPEALQRWQANEGSGTSRMFDESSSSHIN